MLDDKIKKRYADKLLEIAIELEKNTTLVSLEHLRGMLTGKHDDLLEDIKADIAKRSIAGLVKEPKTISTAVGYDWYGEHNYGWHSD